MTDQRPDDDVDIVPEHERRYLVLSIDPDIRRGPSKRIVQAFMSEGGPRIRTVDDRVVTSTVKTGKGLSRIERNYNGDIPIEFARFLINNLPYKVRKRRYERDGWEVDFFEGPLDGLVLAEFEMDDPTQEVVLPSWIHGAEDVTDTLTNRMLGKLAYDLSVQGGDRPVREYLLGTPIPTLVLTGGPGSGKSTAIEALKEQYGDRIQFVPEVATMVIGMVGITPPVGDPIGMLDFQRTIYRVQSRLENGARRQAAKDGKKLVIVDRGTVDASVYMTRGISDLTHLTGGTLADEYARYRSVLCLASPPEEIYTAIVGNNPARSEPYAVAVELGERIKDAWKDHPRYLFVENGFNWQKKLAAIVREVEKFLD